MTIIIVPAGMTYPEFWSECPDRTPPEARHLTEEELAAATAKLIVVCTDVVLVDDQNRFVLATRRHACAEGLWWKGGTLTKDLFPEEKIANILKVEIGEAPERVVFLRQFFHDWYDTRERPNEHRRDNIFLHVAKVTEEEIARIRLVPTEYDVGAGLVRYDGTDSISVRPIVKRRYEDFRRLIFEQPELFTR